jgi:hypothetical protein
VSATSDSLNDVIARKDLCEVELEAKECAPGWSIGRLMSYWCNMWRVCVADADAANDDLEEKEKTVWPDLGAKQVDIMGVKSWTLPETWS